MPGGGWHAFRRGWAIASQGDAVQDVAAWAGGATSQPCSGPIRRRVVRR
jgi:hypothetical protein